MRTRSLIVILLLIPPILLSQPSQLQITASVPPPSVVGVQVVGIQNGGQNVFYWVVTRYPIGTVVSQPATASTVGVANFTTANYVTVSWSGAANGATGYDVVRSTSPSFPSSCAACAVVVNTTATTVNDQGGGSAYTQGAQANGASGTLSLNNLNESAPYMTLQLNGGLYRVAPLAGTYSAGDLVQIGTNGVLVDSGTAASSVCGTTGFTKGSVLFAGTGGVCGQDNARFFWDATNRRLYVGQATGSAELDILAPAGAVTLALAGTAPPGVSSGAGTAASALINSTGPTGGSTSDSTGNRAGGTGGGVLFTGGPGGVNSGTFTGNIFNKAGGGGPVTFTAGAGGNATGGSGATRGGVGGSAMLQSGAGGTSATSTGGSAGEVSLQAGLGGNSTASGATAGPGGTVTINSGTGGNGTNGANGGSAGSVVILGGSGGTSDSGIGGTGGSVIVEAGNGGGGNGSIAIGTQVTAPISIGRSTSTTTLNGNFAFGSGKGRHFNTQAAASDTTGTITITNPATSASITFATSYSNPPACTITPTSNQIATIVSYWVTTSTSAVTANVQTTPGGSITFTYSCFGNPN